MPHCYLALRLRSRSNVRIKVKGRGQGNGSKKGKRLLLFVLSSYTLTFFPMTKGPSVVMNCQKKFDLERSL